MGRKTKASRCITVAILASFLLQPWLLAQSAASQAPDSTTLYLVFLHYQAASAKKRAALKGDGPPAALVAAHLHITPAELAVLDQLASGFLTQEISLRQEANQYSKAQVAAGLPIDAAIIHSFAVRRAALASASIASVQAGISASSFAGLQRFINAELGTNIRSYNIQEMVPHAQ